MKINIKARLKNKTFLLSAAVLIISFVYKLFTIAEIVPPISENELIELCDVLVNILAFLGVIVDPTTQGIADSERALTYFTDNDIREFEEVK